MQEVRFYDSKGIIAKPGEDQQLYLIRASKDLDDLQRFCNDVQGKKIGIYLRGRRLEEIILPGEYEPFNVRSMREYRFSELFIPAVVIGSETYDQLFREDYRKPDTKRSAGRQVHALYGDRELPLTVVTKWLLEEDLSGGETNVSQYEVPFSIEDSIIRHETLHGIRSISKIDSIEPFEELVAYSEISEEIRIKIWKSYFSRHSALETISLFHPLLSISELRGHNYLYNKVKNGIAEQFPLPLLVRINFKEFKDIARQIDRGTEVRKVLEGKYSIESADAWRWELIAELCGF